jgi:glycosyltransferase involved in cell wall biosynthesis
VIASILLYARSLPHHHTGGMETMAWNLATELARQGPAVEIVTSSIPGGDQQFVEDGVRVSTLADTPPGRYSPQWWQASRQDWLARDTAPDVCLSVSAAAYSVVRDRDRHPRTPIVLQAHGTSMMEIASKLRAPSVRSLAGVAKNAAALARDLKQYSDFDRIVAIGDSVADSLNASPQRWSTGDRVVLIPNGVRAQEHAFDPAARARIRSALGIAEHELVVTHVGRLHRQKRVDRALQAMAWIRGRGLADDVRLVLVGDGPEEAALRGLAQSLGLESTVLFVGRVAARQIREYYSAADISVITTSRREGLPMALLEALACGLPCVVPTGAIQSRALTDRLVEVDVSDPVGLADALLATGRQPRRGQSRLPDEHRLEFCAQRYLEVFDTLAADRAR